MTKFTVINAGIDGDTTSEALGRIQSDVLEKTPLLVIIEFGGNDFLRRIPQEATINNVKQMIEKVQAKGAMVAIADISAGVIMGSYHLAFYNLARETNAIFIPEVLSNIFTNSHLKSDFIHPNADGYKIIAQRIYRAILPYLDQNLLARKFGK
jgi:acyl-CoA thioesterase-1